VPELLSALAPALVFERGIHRVALDIGARGPLPCLLLAYPAPASYTGEHSAEIVLPGNPHLIDRVIRTIRTYPGVRDAGPGEYSARAFLSGRISLDQAEGVAALIGAQSTAELDAARDLLSGSTGTVYRAWMEEAATLLALVEAGIDFTDQEDVVPIAPSKLSHRLESLGSRIRAMLGTRQGGEHHSHLPRIVLAGAPNAGKSTLFNALLGRPRALASPVAGTTRDAIAELLDLSGQLPCGPTVVLVDLAGLDASIAVSEAESAAQTQALHELQTAAAVIWCDPSGRFDAPLAVSQGRPIVRVRTKSDLPAIGNAAPDAIGVCALDGWNLDVLRRAIADAAAVSHGQSTWLLPRHRRTLDAAAGALEQARYRVVPEAHALAAPELVARELREAVDQLGELVGHISPDDIIGRVFATFCVGK
jgi:tRNA modification GTPase